MTARIDPESFYDYLIADGLDLFAGVPDSLLKELCSCITAKSPKERAIITANEGNAIAIASGYHISTGQYAVVYMQNSGIGNAINPLLSLADEAVYKIPMLLIIGWRGEPDIKDEPQHVTQGRLTLPLLETMGIFYQVLEPSRYRSQLDASIDYMKKEQKPVALVIRKGTFAPYVSLEPETQFSMKREDALELIIDSIDKDAFVVSTTGKTSREIFEIRERRGESHSHDFLTVGSMGHTASIAFGMALGTRASIYCVDGDGSLIMHMGSLGAIAQSSINNFHYILINNGAHESVGGQPTIAFNIDIANILKSLGFNHIITVDNKAALCKGLQNQREGSRIGLIVLVDQGSRKDLGRPTTTPQQNKLDMMEALATWRNTD